MKLTKNDCRLIAQMNTCYDLLFQEGTQAGGGDESTQKIKLNRVLVKQFEEQHRGFLKSNLPYKDGIAFFLAHFQKLDYKSLHKKITAILLKI